MSKPKTIKQQVEDLKQKLINSDMPTFEINNTFGLVGTVYLYNKDEFGFHLFYIFEPNVTPLSGKDGIITEIYYNLREKKYYVKRNLREVKFNIRNVESMFPQSNFKERNAVIDFISTEKSRGMFHVLYNELGRVGFEKDKMLGRFLHRLITDYSCYELIYKSGVRISYDLKIMDKNGKNPQQILGLTKSEWKIYSKFGVDIGKIQLEARWFESQKKRNTLSIRMLNDLEYISKLEEEYGIYVKEDYFRSEYGDRGAYSIDSIAKRYSLPRKKLIEYLYFECYVSQGIRPSFALNEYRDYMRMSIEMGHTNIDRYPKALRTAHDVAQMNYRVKLDEEQKQKWEDIYDKIKHLTAKYKEWVIFPPKKPEELSNEGNQLSHCVGSYVNNIVNERCVILFMRKTDDPKKSVLTIEIRDGRIVQSRGKFNRGMEYTEREAMHKLAEKLELDSSRFKSEEVA